MRLPPRYGEPVWHRVRQAIRALHDGQFDAMSGIFAELPEEVRRNEWVLHYFVFAMSAHPEHVAYGLLLDQLIAEHPESTVTAVMAIDRHFERNEFDEEGRALQRLLRDLGDDAYLLQMLARNRVAASRIPDALASAQRSVALEPELVEAQTALASAAAAARRFDLVTRAVLALDAMGLEPQGLHDGAEFAEYRRTTEYRDLFGDP